MAKYLTGSVSDDGKSVSVVRRFDFEQLTQSVSVAPHGNGDWCDVTKVRIRDLPFEYRNAVVRFATEIEAATYLNDQLERAGQIEIRDDGVAEFELIDCERNDISVFQCSPLEVAEKWVVYHLPICDFVGVLYIPEPKDPALVAAEACRVALLDSIATDATGDRFRQHWQEACGRKDWLKLGFASPVEYLMGRLDSGGLALKPEVALELVLR